MYWFHFFAFITNSCFGVSANDTFLWFIWKKIQWQCFLISHGAFRSRCSCLSRRCRCCCHRRCTWAPEGRRRGRGEEQELIFEEKKKHNRQRLGVSSNTINYYTPSQTPLIALKIVSHRSIFLSSPTWESSLVLFCFIFVFFFVFYFFSCGGLFFKFN